MPTAQYTEPNIAPEATSIACCTAHTVKRLTETFNNPITVLRKMLTRNPINDRQSHLNIIGYEYLLLFIPSKELKFILSSCICAPHQLFA